MQQFLQQGQLPGLRLPENGQYTRLESVEQVFEEVDVGMQPLFEIGGKCFRRVVAQGDGGRDGALVGAVYDVTGFTFQVMACVSPL